VKHQLKLMCISGCRAQPTPVYLGCRYTMSLPRWITMIDRLFVQISKMRVLGRSDYIRYRQSQRETPSLGQPFWNTTNPGYGGRRPSPLGRGRHLPVRLEDWLRENSLRMETRNAFMGVVRFFFGRLWLISYNHDRKPQLSDSSFRFFATARRALPVLG